MKAAACKIVQHKSIIQFPTPTKRYFKLACENSKIYVSIR